MNIVKFNTNEFNEIIGGGIPLETLMNMGSEQQIGGKQKYESLADYVVPIGLVSNNNQRRIEIAPQRCAVENSNDNPFEFVNGLKKSNMNNIIGDDLFDKLFEKITKK